MATWEKAKRVEDTRLVAAIKDLKERLVQETERLQGGNTQCEVLIVSPEGKLRQRWIGKDNHDILEKVQRAHPDASSITLCEES